MMQVLMLKWYNLCSPCL